MGSSIHRYIVSNLAHRPIRTVLSVLAIAVEVTMILTLVGVSYGTLDGTARRARGVGADIMIRPPGSSILGLSTAPMSAKLVNFLAIQPHGALATGTAIEPQSGFDSITGLDLDHLLQDERLIHFLEGGLFANNGGHACRRILRQGEAAAGRRKGPMDESRMASGRGM